MVNHLVWPDQRLPEWRIISEAGWMLYNTPDCIMNVSGHLRYPGNTTITRKYRDIGARVHSQVHNQRQRVAFILSSARCSRSIRCQRKQFNVTLIQLILNTWLPGAGKINCESKCFWQNKYPETYKDDEMEILQCWGDELWNCMTSIIGPISATTIDGQGHHLGCALGALLQTAGAGI